MHRHASSFLVTALLFVQISGGQLHSETLRPSAGSQATDLLVQKLLLDHHFAGKPLTEE